MPHGLGVCIRRRKKVTTNVGLLGEGLRGLGLRFGSRLRPMLELKFLLS
jgi:hypothetical protein